jgi:serine/threonine protein phosphatase 1
MQRTYVIPDLHGRCDLLTAALEVIEARTQGDPATLVTLGDYVDRGPQSREVIEKLVGLQGDPPTGWRVVCLKGNHEVLLENALQYPARLQNWVAKGGDAALRSYGAASLDDLAVIPERHRSWIAALKLMHLDQHRIYVHAGIDNELPLDRQPAETLLNKRYREGLGDGYGQWHVVHGHDRAPAGPLLYPGRTNLDTMAWSTGRLVIGVFVDDVAGGPVDLIEVKGSPHGEGGSGGGQD